MPNTPIISVVIPAYNEEKLIGLSLKSLMNQNFEGIYEVIVVNNNCTDNTTSVARQFNVSVVTEEKQGVVFARQAGLKAATGDIYVSADADSYYPPGWLSKIAGHFQADANVVAVGGPVDAEPNPRWVYYWFKVGFWLEKLIYRLTGNVFYLGAFNFAMRRQKFLSIGGYRTYFDFGGDELDPLNRLKKIGKVVYDHDLKAKMSSRRYRVGLVKWFFVHFLYYYLFNYYFALIFKRPLTYAKAVREK